MKTLRDYVKGYGYIPILLIAEHRSNGVIYSLTKEEAYDSFYFMKGEEVVMKKFLPNDKFPKLSIQHLNHKKDQDIINQIKECDSYKAFVRFIKEQTGEEFSI